MIDISITTPHSERDTLYYHSEPTPVAIFQREWEFARCLELYQERKPTRVLEIGTFHGGTLYHWLRLAQPGAKVVTLDSYAVGVDNREQYPSWVPLGVELVVYQGDSRDPAIIEAVRQQGPYDWVFIDADHVEASAQADWDHYAPLCWPGGVVVLHDICPSPHDWLQVDRVWRRIQAQGYVTQELVCAYGLDWSGIGVVFV